jgi:hypothetical protein
VTPWLANLTVTAYYQRQQRLLENIFPVQFPAPTPQRFFPISVFRLDVWSETEQRVWTPGLDLQAVVVPAKNHLLTLGLTIYRDRSSDLRHIETTTSLVGQVVHRTAFRPIEAHDRVRLAASRLLHPRRADGHPRPGEPGDLRPFPDQTLDGVRRHVAFDCVPADERGAGRTVRAKNRISHSSAVRQRDQTAPCDRQTARVPPPPQFCS